MTIRDQVLEFHRAFGVPVAEKPGVPSDERVRLRLMLVAEEFVELLEDIGVDAESVDFIEYALESLQFAELSNPNIIGIADAIADLDYVIEGTRLEFGINGEPIAAEVHRSNMAKLGGAVRADGKIMKPAGWTPPDIEGELRK